MVTLLICCCDCCVAPTKTVLRWDFVSVEHCVRRDNGSFVGGLHQDGYFVGGEGLAEGEKLYDDTLQYFAKFKYPYYSDGSYGSLVFLYNEDINCGFDVSGYPSISPALLGYPLPNGVS